MLRAFFTMAWQLPVDQSKLPGNEMPMPLELRLSVAPILATCAAATLSAAHAVAEEGVTADAILFGQVTVLEGPASALGQGMKFGIQGAFDEINTSGGVHGRKSAVHRSIYWSGVPAQSDIGECH